ncbi:MAG: carboxypeptidase-like regulatory domain-containing protein [Bacteroidota bacterium]
MRTIVFFALLFSTSYMIAQTFTGTVVDATSNRPVAFATVITGENQGVITNEDGVFALQLDRIKHPQDSVYISFMGYEKKGLIASSTMDEVIKLVPTTFELKQVFLSTENLSPKEIIEKVKENLSTNYTTNDLSKKKIFFRQSDFNKMQKVDFGFQKSTIPELNKELIDSIAGLVPRSSAHYTEVAGDFYGNYGTHKMKIEKAAELYDKSKDVSFDGLEEKMERIFKENVKPDSYLKIKSGIFSTKLQLDSLADSNEDAKAVQVEVEEQQSQNHYSLTQQVTDRISELYEQLFFNPDSKLDILEKSNRYRFTQRDYTFIDNVPVYVLDFEPKGKKDFKGTLFINTEDFAVLRMEFENVRPLRKFGLLGIKFRENVYRGKMLFTKDNNGSYGPRYVELEQGSFFGVARPLKVIEKNKHVKGRRKQNELSLELDVQTNTLEKFELVVFDSEIISSGAYEGVTTNKEIKATYLSKYDPGFWAGYTIMEPNAAIQAFEVVE